MVIRQTTTVDIPTWPHASDTRAPWICPKCGSVWAPIFRAVSNATARRSDTHERLRYRLECQTSSGCAHRGPHGEMCYFPYSTVPVDSGSLLRRIEELERRVAELDRRTLGQVCVG